MLLYNIGGIECSDSIEDMSDQSYFMKEDFVKKPKSAMEISEIQDWSKATMDDPEEIEF